MKKMKVRITAYQSSNGIITILADDVENGEFSSKTSYRVCGVKLDGHEPELWTKVLTIPVENMIKMEE
jgi:hypothetical protein